MRILVIHEEVPEAITFWDVQGPSSTLLERLRRVNGLMVGAGDLLREEEDTILDLLETLDHGHAGRRIPIESLPSNGPFDHVFYLGSIM